MGLNLCDRCAADCRHERNPNEIVVKCGAYKPPMTNADRIRGMSDEELANFIPDWSYTKACKCDEHEFIGCDNQCEKCVFEWLKQPAEEILHG
ncbi:MAG TPA: hypothetical protein H9745_01930 [Candidatus Agathobaculum stercoravium]|nr:hypothetical protein [Candidatus Agathobaculum stercoravium]